MQTLTKSVIVWLVAFGAIMALMLAFSPLVDAQCQGTSIEEGVDCVGQNIDNNTDLSTVITTVINTMLFIIGILSVVMLIVGGIRYVVSGGNQSQVEGARNTILYAIVGLVIAFVAWGIVNFVVKALSGE